MTTFHAYKVHDGVTEMIDPPDAVVSDARDVSPSARSLDFSSILRIRRMGFLLRKGEFTTIDFQGKTWSRHRHAVSILRANIVGFYVSKDAAGNAHARIRRKQKQGRRRRQVG